MAVTRSYVNLCLFSINFTQRTSVLYSGRRFAYRLRGAVDVGLERVRSARTLGHARSRPAARGRPLQGGRRARHQRVRGILEHARDRS